ncbi:MAG: mechanosensitive ion channel, partial [Desulfobacterales bacterium]|nr:mechanosensitive ion channel [Desulfobacterales bacterium]
MTFSKDQLLTIIADIAPNPLLQALMIIVVFYFLAKIFDLVLVRFVRRWIARTHFTLDDDILEIIHRPVFVSIMLVGLGLAAERLQLPSKVDFITLGGLKTVAIFLWSMAAARFLRLLLGFVSRDQRRFLFIQERTLPLLNNLLIIVVTALAVYFIFLAWQIDVTAWMASAGILGLAISFAAKDTLANLFSGVFIVADAPYKLGDFIVLDSGE